MLLDFQEQTIPKAQIFHKTEEKEHLLDKYPAPSSLFVSVLLFLSPDQVVKSKRQICYKSVEGLGSAPPCSVDDGLTLRSSLVYFLSTRSLAVHPIPGQTYLDTKTLKTKQGITTNCVFFLKIRKQTL